MRLKDKTAVVTGGASGESFTTGNRYPLSSSQQRLYILQQMDQNATVYNMPAVLLRQGRLEEAVTVARKAVELNPLETEARYNLASGLLHSGPTNERRVLEDPG